MTQSPIAIMLRAFREAAESIPQMGRVTWALPDLQSDHDPARAVQSKMRAAVYVNNGVNVVQSGEAMKNPSRFLLSRAIEVVTSIRAPLVAPDSALSFEDDVVLPLERAIAESTLLRTVSNSWYPSGRKDEFIGGTVHSIVAHLRWTVSWKALAGNPAQPV